MKRLLSLFASLLLLAVLWVFFGFAELRQSQAFNDAVLSTQINAIERELDQLTFVPRLLSNDPTIVEATLQSTTEKNELNAPALHLASTRLKETQVATGLEFSFLLNSQGVTVAASNWQDPVSFIGQSYSFRPYFKQAILGQSATYYAVGATTGIPGYFIAEPVEIEGSTLGVVVAKVSLDSIAQSWGNRGIHTVVTDEFGAVILSSDTKYLYRPTEKYSDEAIAKVRSERRYGPFLFSTQEPSEPNLLSLDAYRQHSKQIANTPWRMTVLWPKRFVAMRAFYKAIAGFAVLLIAWLLYSLYRQQRVVMAAEQRISKELEEQVKQRTTELEAIQKTLISESNFAMLGRMSAAINHEVNQPLATLRLNLASLRSLFKEPRLSDESLVAVQQIVTDSDLTTKRIARVITSLRSYARQNRVATQSIDVGDLIAEVRSTIDTERPNMSEHVSYEVDNSLLPIKGDATLLQQGILNLLYNAFDAVLEVDNPSVRVIATSSLASVDAAEAGAAVDALQWNEHVIIRVADNGAGISEDVRESLFEPFTTNRLHSGGLGLGLTITQQIIESHDGQLSCQSSKEGSQFSIQLPIASPSTHE